MIPGGRAGLRLVNPAAPAYTEDYCYYSVGGKVMDSGALVKRVNAGTRIVFEEPGRLCLVLKGRINTASPGLRRELGPGGVIDAGAYAYAIENSELLFIKLERLWELRPDLAARIAGGMKDSPVANRRPLAKAVAGPEPNRTEGGAGGVGTRGQGKKELQSVPGRTAYTYSVDVECPVCGNHFQGVKLFESKLKQVSHDAELRARFEDIEPVHYKVWVCPRCLYADFVNRWSDLSTSQKAALKESEAKRAGLVRDLPEPEESAEKAVNDYRLLIESLMEIKAAANTIAGAWLNMAWLYDDLGAAESAADARKQALAAYEKLYLEARSLSPALEVQALYIIGELNKKLGNAKQAHEYLLRVLHYKEHSMAMLTELARDGLQELKQMARSTE
jgi:uncharacterized protein (DUF2225 family)